MKRKADELGLQYESNPWTEPTAPTRRIVGTSVVPREGGYGVVYEFNDGHQVTEYVGTKAEADYAARDRVGDEVPIVPEAPADQDEPHDEQG